MDPKEQLNIEKDNVKEELKAFEWRVPTCCVEGWSSCEHVAQPVKKNYNENII